LKLSLRRVARGVDVRPYDRDGECRTALFESKAVGDGLPHGPVSLRILVGKGDHVAGQELPPERASSACPDCGIEMVIVRITPILLGGRFEELSLVCKTCGFTKMLRIERS
jgi:predicted RNA-binding Zn-ribbon protein involved in translation (DUF1610 family)